MKINYPKFCFLILMILYGIICAVHPNDFHFLDRVNLIAHEAGHLLFSWFGEFIMVIGGTIGQLFVPAAFSIYFYLRRDFFSSSVTCFWTGQNFINISVYVKDAQAMNLPLVSIGGGDPIHDWNYILSKLSLLKFDQIIGSMVYSLGLIIMVAALVWGFFNSQKEELKLSHE